MGNDPAFLSPRRCVWAIIGSGTDELTAGDAGWGRSVDPDRGFTMSSALKFVAAAAIVALFGGFLLAGVLTTPQGAETVPAAVTASPEPETTRQPTESPSPSVRTDILPGVELTVELVEPGVYPVVDDGMRDLASKNDTDIVADGSVWVLAIDEADDALEDGFFLVDKTWDRDLYVITPEAVAATE